MSLTEQEVLQILRLVKESGFGELRLETGDLKLVFRKGGCGGPVEPEALTDSLRPGPQSPRAALSEPVAAGLPKAPQGAISPSREGTVPIRSPLLGAFYRRPSPDAPPYVEVGSLVEEDDTVCVIEVMKVFTSVKAGVRGRIVEILAENLQMVEYEQPLFLVRPEGGRPTTDA